MVEHRNESYLSTNLTRMDDTMILFKTYHGFFHDNNTYWFVSQVYNNSDIVYTIVQLEIDFDVPFSGRPPFLYTYKELYLIQFNDTYGNVDKVQFVSSGLLTLRNKIFSKLIVVSYRRGKDSLMIIPFENVLPLFDEFDQTNCQYSNLLQLFPVTFVIFASNSSSFQKI